LTAISFVKQDGRRWINGPQSKIKQPGPVFTGP